MGGVGWPVMKIVPESSEKLATCFYVKDAWSLQIQQNWDLNWKQLVITLTKLYLRTKDMIFSFELWFMIKYPRVKIDGTAVIQAGKDYIYKWASTTRGPSAPLGEMARTLVKHEMFIDFICI